MSKLTPSAKKNFAWLLAGNLFILIACIILVQYFFFTALKPNFPTGMVHSLIKTVHQLKTQPESRWPQLLHKRMQGSTLTLSHNPLYQDNALLNLRSPLIYDWLQQNNPVQFSVFIKEKAWLNFNYSPPQSNRLSVFSALISCIMTFLLALLFINYWVVKNLNQPIQTILQSLKYSESQDHWLPIPLTGNTDQIQLFQQINALQAKTSNLLQTRTHVVTAISHDLRTPLTRLKLRLEYQTDNPHCEKMRQDIHDMEMMIQETLDYFKEAHHEETMQRFDLVAMLQSLCEDAADLQFNVQFNSNTDKLIYFGALNLLKRAFCNVINNAIHYGNQARVTLEQSAQSIDITVDDNGLGLPETELEKAFLPFYRAETSRSRETGGTGLGLTIAKEIIKHHKGAITLTNRLEGGLRVAVRFPMKTH
ncbi:MAG: HAMP domain-containing sensor histidine kinase [Tatlockia sp.]|jgi:signal transduction histidine kinase